LLALVELNELNAPHLHVLFSGDYLRRSSKKGFMSMRSGGCRRGEVEMLEVLVTVKRVEPIPPPGVAKLTVEDEDGVERGTLEIPVNIFRAEAGEVMKLILDEEEPKGLSEKALVMRGDVFKLREEERGIRAYISCGGFQQRILFTKEKPPKPFQEVYVALEKP